MNKIYILFLLGITSSCFGYDITLKNNTNYIITFHLPVTLAGCDNIDWELQPGQKKSTHLDGWCAGACFGYPSFAVKNPDPDYTSITKVLEYGVGVTGPFSGLGCGTWSASLEDLHQTIIQQTPGTRLIAGNYEKNMLGKPGYQGIIRGQGSDNKRFNSTAYFGK
jgi:hypothetical protein